MFSVWAASSEFVSSSIPSWQILTVHAQPFRLARDLAFCLKVPLDSLLVWASSRGSGETAWMRRLAWTFAARIGNKYQIGLTRSKWFVRLQGKITHYSQQKVLSYPLSAQPRLWSDWEDAQADLSLRWAHSHRVQIHNPSSKQLMAQYICTLHIMRYHVLEFLWYVV